MAKYVYVSHHVGYTDGCREVVGWGTETSPDSSLINVNLGNRDKVDELIHFLQQPDPVDRLRSFLKDAFDERLTMQSNIDKIAEKLVERGVTLPEVLDVTSTPTQTRGTSKPSWA